MSDAEPIDFIHRRASAGSSAASAGGTQGNGDLRRPVFFDRRELDSILRVYGQRVAAGEWRDYAIDANLGEAVFSVFRRTSEMPIYRVVKAPKDMRRQGAYRVLGASGAILKRGHDLGQVLRVFEKRTLSLVGA